MSSNEQGLMPHLAGVAAFTSNDIHSTDVINIGSTTKKGIPLAARRIQPTQVPTKKDEARNTVILSRDNIQIQVRDEEVIVDKVERVYDSSDEDFDIDDEGIPAVMFPTTAPKRSRELDDDEPATNFHKKSRT